MSPGPMGVSIAQRADSASVQQAHREQLELAGRRHPGGRPVSHPEQGAGLRDSVEQPLLDRERDLVQPALLGEHVDDLRGHPEPHVEDRAGRHL